MIQATVAQDEAIFGSPELLEFYHPINGSMHGGFVTAIDNHFDYANDSPPSNFEDPDGADLLNLISTSLDRFNALLHTATPECNAGADVYTNPGISIPNYSRSNAGEFGFSDNVSNSALPNFWLPSDFPRSVSPSRMLFNPSGSPLGSSSSIPNHQPSKRRPPSPPGLPRLNSQPPIGLDFDSNNSRSQIERNSVFFRAGGGGDKQAINRQPLEACSSLSEISVWDSQWSALPSEMGMLSVDSGIGSESIFHQPWLSASMKTNSEHCPTAKPIEVTPHLKDIHTPSNFDFGGCHDNAQLLQNFKAALQSPSSNNTETIPQNTAANSLLKSMLWSPWPMSASTQNGNSRFGEQTVSSFISRPLIGDGHKRSKISSKSSSSSTMLFTSRVGGPIGPSISNRRKAESCSFSGLLPHGLRSPSVVCQLPPSPPSASHNDLDQIKHQPQSKSFGNSQRFGRDMQSRMSYFSGKPFPGGLFSPQPSTHSSSSSSSQIKGSRHGLACFSSGNKTNRKQQQQARTTGAFIDGLSSSSPSSSTGNDGKPVIAKWRRACSFYLRGHCKKEDCEFAHDLTKVTCKFWELGECFKGSTCPFLHGYPPEMLEEQEQTVVEDVMPAAIN